MHLASGLGNEFGGNEVRTNHIEETLETSLSFFGNFFWVRCKSVDDEDAFSSFFAAGRTTILFWYM